MKSAQTGKPIAGVTVTTETGGQSILTDSAGHYILDTLSPGSYNLIFSHNQFEPLRVPDVYLSGEKEHRLDVELSAGVVTLEKMTVRGTSFRKAPDMASSTKIMSFDEILRSPGALIDIQRAVQNLPSVTSAADNTNEIIVRGGTPGENLLLMDNIEVPNGNQFAQQGTGGGVVSLINPLLVKGLTFSAGAPPAQYGGKASSVLDVKLRDGNDKLIVGGFDVGVAGAGLHAEGPLWPGSTFMLSATKSYLDFLAKFDPTTAVPKYWGGQAKLVQRLGAHKITLNGIYGDNSIAIHDARSSLGMDFDEIVSKGGVFVTGGTLESSWSDRFSSLITLSAVGNTYQRLTYTDSAGVRDSGFSNSSTELEQTLKAQISLDAGDKNRITLGGFVRRCDVDINLWEKPDTLKSYYQRADSSWADSVIPGPGGVALVNALAAQKHEIMYKYGAFLSGIVYLGERLRLVPGIRIDGFTFTRAVSVSPRLNALYTLTPELNITAAGGLQFQDPDYVTLLSTPANAALKPKRAATVIAGLEKQWPAWQIQSVVEGFYKQYDGIPLDSSLLSGNAFTRTYSVFPEGKGRSYGVELFGQKKLAKNLSWSAAYSLSRSHYQDPRPGHAGVWYRGDYDFQQSITLTGGWKAELLEKPWYQRMRKPLWFKLCTPIMPFADRFEVSAKWQYVGGRPYNEPVYHPENRHWMNDYAVAGDLNATRYPDYHTLDIRYERRYGFGFLQMIYYFDLKNIYSRPNVWSYLYSNRTGQKSEVRQLPFFPAGGVIIGF